MKAYLYYYEEDRIDERGFKEEKGVIYCWSKEKLLSPSVYLEVTEDILLTINDYKIIDGQLVLDEDRKKSNETQKLREMREPLFTAFDKYNLSVTRGITQETDIQKKVIMDWYHLILDLDVDAIQNPPKEILYFMS